MGKRENEKMRTKPNLNPSPISNFISNSVLQFSRVSLGVAETIVGSLLCCVVVIVQCLFN